MAASRFHSTQRSSKKHYASTVMTEDSQFDAKSRFTAATSKPVDEELPIKFKRFGKTLKLTLNEQDSQTSINSAAKTSSVR
jgi:hypothetical protein